MNAGERPVGMADRRRDLIAALEELGFDRAGVEGWRETCSDDELARHLQAVSLYEEAC